KAFANFFARRAKHPRWKTKRKSRQFFYIANDKFTRGDHWITVPVLGDLVLAQREANGTQTERIKYRTNYKRKLGTVNMAEALRFVVSLPPGQTRHRGKRRQVRKKVWCGSDKIIGATIGMSGGYWYVSIQVEVSLTPMINTQPVVGVDVGIKELAVVSDGRRFENQKPLATHLTKLKRLNRRLSRAQFDPETKQRA